MNGMARNNETFEDILAVGGKSNSLGRASEVIESVLNNPSRLDELYKCIFAGNPWVRMRAIDSLEKICRLHPDWIEPYLDTILSELTQSTQASIQWHLAQIFGEVSLSATQNTKAISWLTKLITTTNVDWIVSVSAMKTLLAFNRNGLVDSNTLLPLFSAQERHNSHAVRKKAKAFMKELTTS
ncbi:MAG TPA: hypothetical protein VFT59_00190 [Candidatus Saccharimonadales bacterium]|nr:hypothetical protein [Candidatus Saccharimonadales bacterium]